jgi:hypothetical protein
MIATLDSYVSMFGPYHVQTLTLTVQVAQVLWSAGDARSAQHLLEHSAKNLLRYGDHANSIRFQALTALRDLLLDLREPQRAAAVQKEIVDCVSRQAGQDGRAVAAEKAALAQMLMTVQSHSAAA